MNKNQLHAMFKNYINNFERLNGEKHKEYYKWQICHQFKPLMDNALTAPADQFAEALYKVKECSQNIIDSYTQPFYGLVKYAFQEPETVRQMFMDLYTDDEGDLDVQMEKIKLFFDQSNRLLDRYYPGSHLYKQNSHSVSSYLFLYDPDHYYMYKAKQSQIMADCVEFYDDWGRGDNINLHIYYRMCDEILAEIKKNPELLATNRSRYDGSLKLNPGELHQDTNLHILLFDLIYCSSVYDLYEGMVFKRPKLKEKQLIAEQKKKAESLLEDCNQAMENAEKLEMAQKYFIKTLQKVAIVNHKVFGECTVISVDEKYLKVKIVKTGGEKKFSLSTVIANGIVSVSEDGFSEKVEEFKPVLMKADSIPRILDYAERALAPYEKYLD